MKLIRDDQLAICTFVPVEEGEEGVLAEIVAILKPEDELRYGGKASANGAYAICLHAGSHEEIQTETSGSVRFSQHVRLGGVKLVLRGSTPEDEQIVRGLRDTCYFATAGLIFLSEIEVDGKKGIIVTAKRCQQCGRNMLSMVECEWRTCNACAEKCEHSYVRGAVHGGEAGDIGMGHFCEKCGRGKPKPEGERVKSQLEHHLAIEREFGAHVLYDDGGPVATPTQAVQLDRLARRYARSLSRTKQKTL